MEPMDFGERLRTIRKRCDLKQTELAETLGVAVDTVRRWEAGSHEPKLSDVVNIAAALGMTVAELIGEEPLPKEEPRPAPQAQPRKKKETDKIVIQHGLLKVEIPATPEGYAIVKAKLDEFTIDNIPQQDLAKSVYVEETTCPS